MAIASLPPSPPQRATPSIAIGHPVYAPISSGTPPTISCPSPWDNPLANVLDSALTPSPTNAWLYRNRSNSLPCLSSAASLHQPIATWDAPTHAVGSTLSMGTAHLMGTQQHQPMVALPMMVHPLSPKKARTKSPSAHSPSRCKRHGSIASRLIGLHGRRGAGPDLQAVQQLLHPQPHYSTRPFVADLSPGQ